MKQTIRIIAAMAALATLTAAAETGTVYGVADRIIGRAEATRGSADTGNRVRSGVAYEYDDIKHEKTGDWYHIDGAWYWGGNGYLSSAMPDEETISKHVSGEEEFVGTKVSKKDSKKDSKESQEKSGLRLDKDDEDWSGTVGGNSLNAYHKKGEKGMKVEFAGEWYHISGKKWD